MGPRVGWNSLLIELFWLELSSYGSRFFFFVSVGTERNKIRFFRIRDDFEIVKPNTLKANFELSNNSMDAHLISCSSSTVVA